MMHSRAQATIKSTVGQPCEPGLAFARDNHMSVLFHVSSIPSDEVIYMVVIELTILHMIIHTPSAIAIRHQHREVAR